MAVVCLCATVSAHAQPSSASSVSFQGALNGANGQPLANGTYNLAFNFYTNATTTTALATTNVAGVPVTSGIASSAIPVQTDWFDGQTRYLGISVNGSTELTPRVLVTAVPYATYSHATRGISVDPPETYDPPIVFPRPSRRTVLGNTAENISRIPLVDEALVIGTSNGQAGAAIGILFDTLSRTAGAIVARKIAGGSVEDCDMDFYVTAEGSPVSRRVMTIAHTGSVGIGTTEPQTKLDVIGTTRTSVLQITGGADLAEHLSITDSQANDEFKVEPGMVVSIDPTGNRKFKLSDEPYDRKRVGIISGGNGVKPGLVLRDEANPQADGEQPIALTGQVWVHADAKFGSITPGDLLTTSITPGHAMKVSDDAKARFAVLGQALTGLKAGRGWVQVLVGKQ